MKKNLVVGMVGDESLHKSWIDHSDRNFDLYLVYFGKIPGRYIDECENYAEKKGSKYPVLKEIIKNDETFFQYDAIFFPDDDLIIHTPQINRLFEIFHLYKLLLAQPSLIGYYNIYTTIHDPNYTLRYSNLVEIMMPCFSRYSFEKCWQTFDTNISSWGIDSLWPKILGYPKNKIAVIDEVIAIHTRVPGSGGIYKSHRANPWEERNKLIEENDLPCNMEVYLQDSIAVNRKNKETSTPFHRFYPNIKEIKQMLWKLRLK